MGKTIPSYGKILQLGSVRTENLFVGKVVVQEKVDGSQFRFYHDTDGDIVVGTKGTTLGHEDENKMFSKGFTFIQSIADKIKSFPKNTVFYGEYLGGPRHNVLCYERTPINNVVLFDVVVNGRFMERAELESTAKFLGLEVVPELFNGEIEQATGLDKIKEIIGNTDSFLGREKIEGVVIKNYSQTILLGGNVFPLFCKYVRPEFKERHGSQEKEYKPKSSIQDYINSFKSEARWQKAIIHMKEKGLLLKEPKDIGELIKTIRKDIQEEEAENIKEYLYEKVLTEILRASVAGVAEYYKEKLAKGEV